MGHRRAILLIGVGLLLFHGLCAAMLCGAPIEKLLQRRWVPVPCVIASTSLVSVSGRSSGGKERGSRPGYRLDVAYRYERDGLSRVGDRWALYDAGFGGREALEARARALPAGRAMTCYVHPGDPSRAVLYRERITVVDVVLLALCLGLVPAALLAWMIRAIAGQKKTPGAG